MAARFVSAVADFEKGGSPAEAWFDGPALDDDRTVQIPKWLMVLAACGDVTLRVAVDLEDDPLDDELDETLSGD